MVVCRNPPSPTQGSGKAAQDSLTVTVDSVDLFVFDCPVGPKAVCFYTFFF